MEDSGALDELVIAVGCGSEEAMTHLERYARKEVLPLFRSTFKRSDLEDFFQDGIVQLWRSAHTFDPEKGAAGPWIRTIFRRKAIDQLRKHGRNREMTASVYVDRKGDEYDLIAFLAEDDTTPDTRLMRDEERKVLKDVKDKAGLTAEQKELIAGRLHGWTQRVTCETLGIPFGTVKSRGARADEKLIRHAAAHYPEFLPSGQD
jgi:RNA polymerase sigma-70 factor (ECF subfamily)